MSFGFKKEDHTEDLPDLDSPPPPGGGTGSGSGSGSSGSGASQATPGRSYEATFSQALFEKEIQTKVATQYYKFTVRWIGGPNGSQMVVDSIDERPTAITANKKIGIASGYVVKDRSTGEVYVHTLNNGINMVTPLDDVKVLTPPAQAGIAGAYTYYLDQSVKGKKAKAKQALLYQTFSASFVAGPNGSVLQIGNISTAAKTWNAGNDMGIASGYIIESQGKKYIHTHKDGTNYATLYVPAGIEFNQL